MPTDLEILFGALLSGPFVALMFFVTLWGPKLMFRGLLLPTSAKRRSMVPPFSLTDMLVLLAFLATANGVLKSIVDNWPNLPLLLAFFATNLFVALLWIKCLQFLEQYNITRQRSRLLFELFLFPASIYLVSEYIVGGFMILMIATESLRLGGWNEQLSLLTLAFIVVIVGTLLGTTVVRLLFRRSIALEEAKD